MTEFRDKYEEILPEEPQNQPFPGIRLKTIEVHGLYAYASFSNDSSKKKAEVEEKTPNQLKEEEERNKLNELAKDLPFLLGNMICNAPLNYKNTNGVKQKLQHPRSKANIKLANFSPSIRLEYSLKLRH